MLDPHPDLTAAMRDYAVRAVRELKYDPRLFLDMLNDRYGHETAETLVLGSKPSYGFFKLAELKRLDFTVEALVLQPRWSGLFKVEVLQAARKRLTDFGYVFPPDAWTPLSAQMGNLGPPPRMPVVVDRIIRDGPLAAEVKALHACRCQLCGLQLLLPGDRLYAEAHHIRPLGNPHHGPDQKGNLMCVCPNCHVLLDYAAVPLDVEKLSRSDGHEIDPAHIEHHNARYRGGNPPEGQAD